MTWKHSRFAGLGSSSVALMMALLVLTACSSTQPVAPVEIRTVEVEVDRPVPRPPVPNPQPVDLADIDWVVITPDTLPEGDAWVLFGLTPEMYERLSGNTAELLRWIEEAGWRIRYYRGEVQVSQIPG